MPVPVPVPQDLPPTQALGARFQRRLVLFCALGMAVVAAATLFAAVLPSAALARQETNQGFLMARDLEARLADSELSDLQGVALQIASRTKAREKLAEYNRGAASLADFQAFSLPILSDALRGTPEDLAGILRLDARGREACAVGVRLAPDQWPAAPPRASGAEIAGVRTVGGAPHAVVWSPIADREGKRVGSDLLLFRLGWLERLASRSAGTWAGGRVRLALKENGRTLLLVPDAEGRQGVSATTRSALEASLAGEAGVLRGPGRSGRPLVVAHCPLGRAPWALALVVPRDELYRPVDRGTRGILGVLAVLLLCAGTALWLVLRLAGRQIVRRADALEALAAERTRDLERANRELARSNAELDEFASAVSHDLKAPLRGISHLAGWIQEELAGDARPETRANLALMRGRVKLMDAMLDGLLQYCRAGRAEERVARVDVAALVDEVWQLLAPPPGFELVRAGPLPVFETDQAPLELVFRNLLSNALAHHDRPAGRIQVSCEDGGNRWRFAVADDGPGIPPGCEAKLFRIFQTLKPRDQGGGTGLGLAMVKKTVEHHGGSVSLEPGEAGGRGATFRFSWPKSPPRAG